MELTSGFDFKLAYVRASFARSTLSLSAGVKPGPPSSSCSSASASLGVASAVSSSSCLASSSACCCCPTLSVCALNRGCCAHPYNLATSSGCLSLSDSVGLLPFDRPCRSGSTAQPCWRLQQILVVAALIHCRAACLLLCTVCPEFCGFTCLNVYDSDLSTPPAHLLLSLLLLLLRLLLLMSCGT